MIKDNQKSSFQTIIFVAAMFYSVKQATSAAIDVPIDNGADQLTVNILKCVYTEQFRLNTKTKYVFGY